ncbi:MAG: D-alanyl-D-alanine carboxypeptidase/D-alanyl-D-alanine-endopeptidase [Thermodesulfobacteriota bacterium]
MFIAARALAIVLSIVVLLAPAASFGEWVSSAKLNRELTKLISGNRSASARIGVAVKSLKTGKVIFSHNAGKMFVPASNVKVFLSAAALQFLKPDYRFKTEFYITGPILHRSIYGDMYVKGYGDPTMRTSDLRFIARELKKLGIDRIMGSIMVDETFFDSVRFGLGWKKKWKGLAYSPPISALSLNYNTFEVSVYPTRVGLPPRVEIDPKGAGIKVVNRAVTSSRWGRLYGDVREGGGAMTIRGRISSRSGKLTVTKAVPVPPIYTGRVLRANLKESGIEVEGDVALGKVPSSAHLLYTHYSDTLDRVINLYNKSSVNLIGENIIKVLGAKYMGAPGTWEKGANVVGRFLGVVGVKEGARVVDGSGLSPLNRSSPEALVEVLRFAYRNKLISHEFVTSLSIGGVDGTLEGRFKKSELEGRVMAKTGYLKSVRTLSGYLFTKSGDVLAFSILSNGLGSEVKEIQQNLLMKLVECCRDTYIIKRD